MIFFAGLSMYLLNENGKLNVALENTIEDYNNANRQRYIAENNLNVLIGNKSKSHIQNKLKFFDENIVFVITGYGNYYSDYDCMLQRVGNNNYTYLAFNKTAAIGKGYTEYKCR